MQDTPPRGPRPGRLLVLAGLILADSGFELFGSSGAYLPEAVDRIDVVMPANPPHINQQFVPHDGASYPGHDGIDIWARRGTPARAAAAGRVVKSHFEPLSGNRVEIDHGRDAGGRHLRTVCLHLNARKVETGTQVARGQPVGKMGSTGALGLMVQVHFEAQCENDGGRLEPLDPHLFWLRGVGRVTCYAPEPRAQNRPFGTTYPVPCKGS